MHENYINFTLKTTKNKLDPQIYIILSDFLPVKLLYYGNNNMYKKYLLDKITYNNKINTILNSILNKLIIIS